MKEKYKYLSKNILLFSLSGFVPKVLSFVLVPLYTGILTTTEYGISDLITTTVTLLLPIFTCDVQDAVMRFAMDKSYNQKSVFSIGLRVILIGGAIVSLCAIILSFFNIDGIKNEYLLFGVLMFFSIALYNVCSLFCRAIDEVKTIAIGSIINSATTLGANIFLLAVINLGLTGYLIANSVGAIVSLLYIFFKAKLYHYLKKNVDINVWKNMLLFSLPLIFSVIGWWINNASDRYILTWMTGVAVSGVYAVSYKIPNLLSVFQNVFAQAWSISAIKEYDYNDTDGFIGKMYTLMNFAMLMACSGIMIINRPIAKILYANDFYLAWQYVPPLLISVVFNAMALFVGSIFTAVKDTKILSASTIAGAVVNTGCNIILIYYYGAYGAAIATMLGYAATLIIRRILLFKHIRMKVNNIRDILGYIILILQMIIAKNVDINAIWQLTLFLMIMFLYLKEEKDLFQFVKKMLLTR